jgi:hypothetical protein
MGTSTDRFDYLRENMRSAAKEDPEYAKQKELYRKIKVFCTACNTPDIVCETSVCHFYSLKAKAISEAEAEERHFGAYNRKRFEMKGRDPR